jgi:hypothetical protein
MLLFTVLTLGLYVPIWFLRRRTALNALDSPKKLESWPFVAFLGVQLLALAIDVAAAPSPPARLIGPGPALLLTLLRLGVSILMIVLCFRTRDILEDHLTPDPAGELVHFSQRVQLSGLMTFFFSIYYLQYTINRHVAGVPARVV